MSTIKFTRISESEVSRAESMTIETFLSQNKEKVFQVVSGMIEKTFAAKVKKLDSGASITFNLDSVLNDLVISASGRITRETFLEYFLGRKEEISALIAFSKGISPEKLQNLNQIQIEKLFALTQSLIERLAICLSARQNSPTGFSVSLGELNLISKLPEIPESFSVRISEAISSQDIFSL